jgi:hypothetical protein
MKKLLFNLFEKYSEKKLLISGIAINLIGLLLCFYFNVNFLGFLKTDYVQTITWFQVIKHFLIIISTVSIVVFIIGKVINFKTRFIDVLNSVLIAKIPFYLLAPFNYNGLVFEHLNKIKILMQSGKLNDASVFGNPAMIVFSLVSLLVLVWTVSLLYKGFKIATNAKNTKQTIVFFVGIIAADAISRILIYHLN